MNLIQKSFCTSYIIVKTYFFKKILKRDTIKPRTAPPQNTMNYRCPKCSPSQNAILKPTKLGAQCPICHSIYPKIDDTLLLVDNHEQWLSSQGPMMLLRTDLSVECTDFLLRHSTSLRHAQKQLYSYLSAPKGTLHQWVHKHLEHQTGVIVDLGCGVGLHNRQDIIGVDANWTLLSRYPGTKVVADISNPPFFAHSLDCILLLNVVDSCETPFLLLQQVDALLKKGGSILFSSPFTWNDDITAPEEQFSPEHVEHFFLSRGYTIKKEEHTWFVQGSPRSCTQYNVFAWYIRS